ncbi:hypothetical protein TMatcc_007326 [Talaromyces marneffei ATCC 18224]
MGDPFPSPPPVVRAFRESFGDRKLPDISRKITARRSTVFQMQEERAVLHCQPEFADPTGGRCNMEGSHVPEDPTFGRIDGSGRF